jgi:hypothetical protein
MEETLNKILSELQHTNGRLVNIESGQTEIASRVEKVGNDLKELDTRTE